MVTAARPSRADYYRVLADNLPASALEVLQVDGWTVDARHEPRQRDPSLDPTRWDALARSGTPLPGNRPVRRGNPYSLALVGTAGDRAVR